eukprot:gene5591-40887_t
MDTGTFVAFVSAALGFGHGLSRIFKDIFLMGDGFASVVVIADFLNADTRRKQMHRAQERRARLMGDAAEPDASRDLVVRAVSYSFDWRRKRATGAATADVAPMRAGKGTGKTAHFARLGEEDKLRVLELTGQVAPGQFSARKNEGKTAWFARLDDAVKLDALRSFDAERRAVRDQKWAALGAGARKGGGFFGGSAVTAAAMVHVPTSGLSCLSPDAPTFPQTGA